jgi:hypothetical protein
MQWFIAWDAVRLGLRPSVAALLRPEWPVERFQRNIPLTIESVRMLRHQGWDVGAVLARLPNASALQAAYQDQLERADERLEAARRCILAAREANESSAWATYNESLRELRETSGGWASEPRRSVERVYSASIEMYIADEAASVLAQETQRQVHIAGVVIDFLRPYRWDRHDGCFVRDI